MKVWELIHELSRAPANCQVVIGKGEQSFRINDVLFQDYDINGFLEQAPVSLETGEKL